MGKLQEFLAVDALEISPEVAGAADEIKSVHRWIELGLRKSQFTIQRSHFGQGNVIRRVRLPIENQTKHFDLILWFGSTRFGSYRHLKAGTEIEKIVFLVITTACENAAWLASSGRRSTWMVGIKELRADSGNVVKTSRLAPERFNSSSTFRVHSACAPRFGSITNKRGGLSVCRPTMASH